MLRKVLGYPGSELSAGPRCCAAGSQLALLVNNLGSTSAIEMGIVVSEALDYLTQDCQVGLDSD